MTRTDRRDYHSRRSRTLRGRAPRGKLLVWRIVVKDAFPVPAGRHRIELVERRSRFIATVDRATTVAEARALVNEVRAEMPDATHHVYAFRVGHGATETCGMSDGGEPPGTAGRPMLAVVRGSDLGDLCVVVTRYFGGTKLGTGGLARAYGTAARRVLTEVPKTSHVETVRVRLVAAYSDFDAAARLLESHGGVAVDVAFAADVTLEGALPAARLASFEHAVADATAGRAALEEIAPDEDQSGDN